VELRSLDHTFPDDVDVLLVGPGGQQATLLSDVGGSTDVVAVDLVLDDEAGSFLSDDAAITSGTYRPTDFTGGTDSYPAPAPASTGATALSVFDGTSPNGVWNLYVLDDSAGDSGDFSGGWSIDITTTATSPLASSLYPSTVAVTGLPRGVTDVNVTLNSFDHDFPDDVDILLAGPTGQRVTLMSDVGGSGSAANVNLTLDDAAASALPDSGPLVAGSFRPTNAGDADDSFPAPVPASPPAAGALSAFDGTDPNGTWSLYVVDDGAGQEGDISGGWSLQIATADVPTAPVITAPASPSTDADGTVTLLGSAPAGSAVQVFDGAVATGSPVAAVAGSWSVTLAGVPNGTHTYTATATDGFGNGSAASAAVSVRVDTVHPRVVRNKPAKRADNVRRKANVRVWFSEKMRPGSITRSSVRIVKAGRSKAVKARVTYAPVLRRATINPRKKLAPNTKYKVVVTTARDLAGNALDQKKRSGTQPKVWRFTTR